MSGRARAFVPSMASVVIATAFGGPEVLSVADQPTAEPGPGDAPVDIVCSSDLMSGRARAFVPSMASVVIATAFGGPEVLSVADQPTAEPGPGEARIEVRAAGVNPIDAKAYSGAFGSDPARLPLRLGSEAAGV